MVMYCILSKILTLPLNFCLTRGLNSCQTILKIHGSLTKWTSFMRSGIASWMKLNNLNAKLGESVLT
jgi:hypothetical protein